MSTLHQDYLTMVKELSKPGASILEKLTPDDCNMLHMAIGQEGEAIELYDAFVRMDTNGLIEEAGDGSFFLTNLCTYGPQTGSVEIDISDQGVFNDFLCGAEALSTLIKRKCIYRKDITDEEVGIMAQRQLLRLRTLWESWEVSKTVSFEDVMRANMAKLRTGAKPRYGATYSDDAANARADKA